MIISGIPGDAANRGKNRLRSLVPVENQDLDGLAHETSQECKAPQQRAHSKTWRTFGPLNQRASVLECGGKRSATPLWILRKGSGRLGFDTTVGSKSKAPSPRALPAHSKRFALPRLVRIRSRGSFMERLNIFAVVHLDYAQSRNTSSARFDFYFVYFEYFVVPKRGFTTKRTKGNDHNDGHRTQNCLRAPKAWRWLISRGAHPPSSISNRFARRMRTGNIRLQCREEPRCYSRIQRSAAL